MKATNWLTPAWALLGVPLLFAGYVHLAYKISFARGLLPYVMLPVWVTHVVWDDSFLSGVAAIIFIPYGTKVARITGAVLYAPVFGAALFYLGLLVACANGDCL